MYRTALRLRSEHLVGDESLEWVESGPTTMTFRRGSGVTVVVNFGQDPVALPEGEVLVSSRDLRDGMLPADSAAWVATPDADGPRA
jgi:alpha-glucosidase